MTAIVDPVTDADLDAYVDDQLDVARRIEVEAFLSARPEVAARVMSDLRTRDELRVALAGPGAMARTATTDAARRLERVLARDRAFSVLQRAAAAAVLVAAGWLANGVF
ncbi:anti-sigma factor, partial [Mesorhizobium sp.]